MGQTMAGIFGTFPVILSNYIDIKIFYVSYFVQYARFPMDKTKNLRYDIFIKCGGYAADFERGDSYGVFLFRRDPSQRK